MTIWVATIPITQSEDTFDSSVSATPFTPPYGFKLLKRSRGVTMEVEGISITLNLYKLGFKDPADDIFWVGDPSTDEPGMTDENQTAINRVLCELFRKVELDMKTNLMTFWYLPKNKTPDGGPEGKLLPPIFDLRIINFIRARWMTRNAEVTGHAH
jgi:hypothetical protein